MVKITIRGDEGVPVQVDGEAWIQPPGVIKIQHKNRAQMLTRDRVSNPLQSGGWSRRNLAVAKLLGCRLRGRASPVGSEHLGPLAKSKTASILAGVGGACALRTPALLVSHGQLVSPQAFESTLKSWEDKQKGEAYRAPSRLRLSSQQSMEYLTEEEAAQMQQLVRATETLISRCQPRQTLKVAPLQRLPRGAAPQLVVCACGRCLAASVPHHG